MLEIKTTLPENTGTHLKTRPMFPGGNHRFQVQLYISSCFLVASYVTGLACTQYSSLPFCWDDTSRRPCQRQTIIFASGLESRAFLLIEPSLACEPITMVRVFVSAIVSSYVVEVPSLKQMDWISRHDRFFALHGQTMDAVERRMPPDLLLTGKSTGTKAKKGEVIRLHDKKPKPKQTKLCRIFGLHCNCHR